MSQDIKALILLEMEKVIKDSPKFGNISLTVHFSYGSIVRMERGRNEIFKIDSKIEIPTADKKVASTNEVALPKPLNLVPIKEVTKILRISLPTLYRHMKKGLIKPVRIGARVFISSGEIERIMMGST